MINDFHEDAGWERFHVVHEDTVSVMLEWGQGLKSILIMLAGELELSADVAVMNKITDCLMHVWSPVCSENELETLFTAWVATSSAVMS